jgi:cellulose synthase/poly-beta-1,6-N-acetylglucosamine synthase-like glycosyltransferase
MKISLVSTCLNENNSIKKWKSDILSQTKQPDEICIVDAGSKDGTIDVLNAWASEDARVKIIVSPKCTVAQGRNLAIKNTYSDIIVSTDMGCLLDSHWINEIVKPLLEDAYLMISAGYHEACYYEPLTIANKAECYLKINYARLRENFLPSSRSIAYRRIVWERIGGYPEDLTFAADDTVFALQIHNYKIKMKCVPTAKVFNYRPSTMIDYCKESWNYARGNGEALIYIPIIYKILKRKSRMPWILKFAYALYKVTQQSIPGMMNSLKSLDIRTLFYIPYFIYRRSLSALDGYEIGLKDGSKKCQKCRARLQTSNQKK